MANKEITLLDVIDRAQLQSLQDAFAKATGMAALATDKNGPVTQLSCPTDFCMNYTRKSSVGCERCNLCDLKGGEQASKTGRPAVYYCHGGLVDFASPIIVNGEQIGSLIGGQVLTEEPDLDKFRAIAKEIDVDPDEYVEAVKKSSDSFRRESKQRRRASFQNGSGTFTGWIRKVQHHGRTQEHGRNVR